MAQMKRHEPNRRANIWTARVIPLFLLGIIGYSAWVLTRLVCVEYLLNPPSALGIGPQRGSAIAVLTIFYLLLCYLLICFTRLISTIATKPGFVPRGSQYYVEKARKETDSQLRGSQQQIQANKEGRVDTYRHDTATQSREQADDDSGYQVQDFWKKDVFICSYDGRPAFCSTCYNWKPDRAHHCKELDRCVYKMDHFCPWVAGIVSETSFKFFIQFTFSAALLTLHTLVVMAYFYAQRRKHQDFVNVHWILVIAFASMFLLFGGGMFGSSLQLALVNMTTIENLSRNTKVWYIAVYVSPETVQKVRADPNSTTRLITYPRPPSEQLAVLHQNDANVNPSPSNESFDTIPQGEVRTFAILETSPGANPWYDTPFTNFQDVMGTNILEWSLPIKYSPCTRHDSPVSLYRFGPVVRRLERDAGLLDNIQRRHSSRRRRKRRRRSTSGSHAECNTVNSP